MWMLAATKIKLKHTQTWIVRQVFYTAYCKMRNGLRKGLIAWTHRKWKYALISWWNYHFASNLETQAVSASSFCIRDWQRLETLGNKISLLVNFDLKPILRILCARTAILSYFSRSQSTQCDLVRIYLMAGKKRVLLGNVQCQEIGNYSKFLFHYVHGE